MNLSRILIVICALYASASSQGAIPPAGADPTAKPAADSTAEQATKESTKESAKTGKALYREAHDLMKAGKRKEGYATAQKAMAQFIAEDNDLAWMLLEYIEVGDKRIEVRFNMGERERKMPDAGIVRPLSFRIWSGGDQPELVQILDFEIGRNKGKSVTAAIGETTESGHANYGILPVDSSYETIRKRVVDLVTQD